MPQLQFPSDGGHEFPECDGSGESTHSEANTTSEGRETRRLLYKSHTARLVREATAADIEKWPTSARSLKPQPPTWALPASPTTKPTWNQAAVTRPMPLLSTKRPPSARRWIEVKLTVTKTLSPLTEMSEDAASPDVSTPVDTAMFKLCRGQSSPAVAVFPLFRPSPPHILPPMTPTFAGIQSPDNPDETRLASIFSPRPHLTHAMKGMNGWKPEPVSRPSIQNCGDLGEVSVEDDHFSTTSSVAFTSNVVPVTVIRRPCAVKHDLCHSQDDPDDGEELIIRDTEQIMFLVSQSLPVTREWHSDDRTHPTSAFHPDGTRSANAVFRRLSAALQFASSYDIEDGL